MSFAKREDVEAGLQRGHVLVLPIGLPGAGKSTLGRDLIAAVGWPKTAIVSTDDLRVSLGGRRDWTDDDEAVFRIAEEITAVRLGNRLPVYLDATNVEPVRRSRVVHAARRCGALSLVVRMELQPTECRGRRAQEVTYEDAVWEHLVRGWQAIQWDDLGVPWIHEEALRTVLHKVNG